MPDSRLTPRDGPPPGTGGRRHRGPAATRPSLRGGGLLAGRRSNRAFAAHVAPGKNWVAAGTVGQPPPVPITLPAATRCSETANSRNLNAPAGPSPGDEAGRGTGRTPPTERAGTLSGDKVPRPRAHGGRLRTVSAILRCQFVDTCRAPVHTGDELLRPGQVGTVSPPETVSGGDVHTGDELLRRWKFFPPSPVPRARGTARPRMT